MDDATRREIDEVCWKTLKEAGIVRPPVRIENVLEHLNLRQDFYDLQDPGFLDRISYKTNVDGRKLADIIRSIRLVAVLLYDENRIVLDARLPSAQRDIASFHEVAHRILPWHRPFFYGDTAQTLDPDFQERLEAEANYCASVLMFCGPAFTQEALGTTPEWDSVAALTKRYGKSYLTTLRRYVEHSHAHPLAMLVSTPPWMDKLPDQRERWRHFVPSKMMASRFGSVAADDLVRAVDANIERHAGGRVADFDYCLIDDNGDAHEFRVESFFNSYYVLSLFVALGRLTAKRIVVASSSMERK